MTAIASVNPSFATATAAAKPSPSPSSKLSTVDCTINDLRMKESAFWDCVGREEVVSQCYRYAFMPKSEYDFVALIRSDYKMESLEAMLESTNRKHEEIFPAIEPDCKTITIVKKKFKKEQIFQNLSYECRTDENGRTILWLPGKGAIEVLFEIIRKPYPHLKPIKIYLSEGTAGHLDFVKMFLDGYDALISDGSEFMHDQISHFMSTILFMFDVKYYECKSAAQAVIRIGYNRIMCVKKLINDQSPLLTQELMNLLKAQLPKIEATLGAHVDAIWATSTPKELESFVEELALFDPETTKFMKIWNDPDYARFGRRIFGEDLNPNSLNKAWKLMTDLEKQYEAQLIH